MTKNFFDELFSVLDENLKVFNNDIKESAFYKSETWKDGKCVQHIDKEWENGKLVKSIGDAEECEPECISCNKESLNCKEDECKRQNKECKCEHNKVNYDEVLNANIKLNETVTKLRNENESLRKDISCLQEKNSDVTARFLKVVEENKELKEKINKIKNLF